MKIKYLLIITVIISLFALLNCSENQYKYEDGLLLYLKEVHNIDSYKSHSFIIIAIDDCHICVENTIESIERDTSLHSEKIVLVGDTENEDVLSVIHEIYNENDIYVDSNSLLNEYELGYSGPFYFDITNGHINNIISLK